MQRTNDGWMPIVEYFADANAMRNHTAVPNNLVANRSIHIFLKTLSNRSRFIYMQLQVTKNSPMTSPPDRRPTHDQLCHSGAFIYYILLCCGFHLHYCLGRL